MTRDDVIQFAVESRLYSGNPRTPGTGNIIVPRLIKFAALVAAHEREECAKVCETAFVGWPMNGSEQRNVCAAAIRARSA